jgi:ankyrin repeat protein
MTLYSLEPSSTNEGESIEYAAGAETFEVYVNKGASLEKKIDVDSEDLEIFELLEKQKWARAFAMLQVNADLAMIPVVASSSVYSPSSHGNLLLHHACKNQAPEEIIDCLLDANPSAVSTTGNSGCLPLHYACATGASGTVIGKLLEIYPGAIKIREERKFQLPLHLAARQGASVEILSTLLAYYPDAIMIHDGNGNCPVDYARKLKDTIGRIEAVATLEFGFMLMDTAKATTARLEEEFDERRKTLDEDFTVYINAMKSNHEEEISKITSALFDVEFDREIVVKELQNGKEKMDELDSQLQDKLDKIGSKQEPLMQLQEDSRLQSVKLETKYEEEVEPRNEVLGGKTEREAFLETELVLKSSSLEELEEKLENQRLLHSALANVEQRQFDAICKQRLWNKKELQQKIDSLQKRSDLKDRLIRKINTMSREQNNRDTKNIDDLLIATYTQGTQLKALKDKVEAQESEIAAFRKRPSGTLEP